MADQQAAGWSFDARGDDLPANGNDNVPRTIPADAYVAKNIDALRQSLIAGGRHVGESHECVALVKHAVAEIGRAANWAEGTKITGYNDPPLEPRRALATFSDGTYQNKLTGNHAGLFVRFDQKDGQKGFWLLEQMRNNAPHERFIAFDAKNQNVTSQAQNYSVIRRPPTR